jgi:hypothetical protein
MQKIAQNVTIDWCSLCCTQTKFEWCVKLSKEWEIHWWLWFSSH